MLTFLKSFRASEDGAVTVDWVVLTAAIVGLGVSIITVIGASATDKSTSVGAQIGSMSIKTTY